MNTNREQLALDTLQVQKSVISGLGATYALSKEASGSLVIFDRAAGTVVTLPTFASNGKAGMYFDFQVATSVTSNSFKVITGAGTELLIGGYTSVDTDSTNATAVFTANGSSHVAITMAAASTNATGGLKGTSIRLTCLSATQWLIEGTNMCAGTPTTAFTTS